MRSSAAPLPSTRASSAPTRCWRRSSRDRTRWRTRRAAHPRSDRSARAVALAPLDVGQPCERLSEQRRASGCSNSPVRPPGCTGMSNVGELLDQPWVRGATANEHRDVLVAKPRVDEVVDQARDPASLLEPRSSPLHTTTSGSAPPPSARCVPIVFVDPVRDRLREPFATSMICGRLRRFVVISNVATDWIALGEIDDVRDIRAAPLVDRLLVVADHAQLHSRAGQQPISRSCAGLTSWYSSTIRWRRLAWTVVGQSSVLELRHCPHDLLTIGQQPVAVERLVVVVQDRAERVGQLAPGRAARSRRRPRPSGTPRSRRTAGCRRRAA